MTERREGPIRSLAFATEDVQEALGNAAQGINAEAARHAEAAVRALLTAIPKLRGASSELVGCPRCGAHMKKRSGKHGEFFGCSRYPKCRGTRSGSQTGIATCREQLPKSEESDLKQIAEEVLRRSEK